MNELIINDIKIENLIYEIRGIQVMLDSDLAKLYGCTNGTKDVNKAVNRNIEKFPKNFYFQLTNDEYKDILRFHYGTLELEQGQYSKYLPHVFTEQGVAMLASVLRTNVAAKVSVNIMQAFVAMKKYIYQSNYLINSKFLEYDKSLLLVEETLNKMNDKLKVNTIFFEGQIYDAHSLLLDILNKAKEEIIIIDNYAGKELLDILKNIDKKIVLVSKNFDEELVKKYNKQYSNVEFKIDTSFHDRFIIIDKNTLYHSGASFKELGKKCFAINKIDEEILNILLNKLNFYHDS